MLRPASLSVLPRRSAPAALIAVLCCSVLFGLLAARAHPARAAQQALCPTGVTTLFVPVPSGSQTDRLYEALVSAWGVELRVTLVTEALSGRGGSYAVSRVLDERNDGCYLTVVQLPSFIYLADLPGRMYGPDDIALLGVFASLQNALWVPEDSPFQTLGDLAEAARAANGQPGGVFTLAGVGSYTDQHLASRRFDRAAGVKTAYMPVVGPAAAIAAVKQGRAQACWGYALARDSMPGMRPLGVAGRARSPALPATPTFYEAKIDMESSCIFGLGVSSAVTEEKREQMGKALEPFFTSGALRQGLKDLGATPLSVPFARMRAYLDEMRRYALLDQEDYGLKPRP